MNHLTKDGYLFPEEKPLEYLLLDNVPLRDKPTENTRILAYLKIGTKLVIKERSADSLLVEGILSNWYKVLADGKSGWIWGGAIAQQSFGSEADPEVKFVMGQEKMDWNPKEGKSEHLYQIRAFRKNVEIDKISIKLFTPQVTEMNYNGTKGLSNVDDILSMHIPCRGGRCTTGDIYIFWHKNKLYRVAELLETPDGAMSNNSSFIFPSDMDGIPNVIIKQTCSYEKPPKPADPKQVASGPITRKLTNEYLMWNGTNLLQAGIKPDVKTYIITGK